ncbi:Long-chain-fatty-acid--CoA ligase [Rhodococcus wratislaviensis]|uniref:Long-chain-fatty-acid--CoA ligase n=1 Tax=Rhodococcus wratislaviensis TaxID=44752 RepID=A0A402C7B9_RHOWR|nr:AMP-binding protein [Rhodococcus wratislaviensis]GCE39458.1 Long-chain-fatty-acid--CoA ligase [Rhodococcus wratislaviensis]
MYPPAIATEHPDSLAFVMAESGTSLTYRQLDEQSNQLAHLLRSRGVTAGASIVLVMENRIEWPVVVAAGMRAGLYVTPVNWHLTPGELAALLAEAAPAAVVTSGSLAGAVAAALPDGHTALTLCTDPAPEFEHLATAIADHPRTPIADERFGARVLYSGGTTGRPKAFRQKLLDIHPADAPTRHAGLALKLGIDSDTVLLSPAPNYHAAPFTFQLMTMAAGGTVVCMERFDASAAMTAIAAHGVTHSQWVPTMLLRILALPDRGAIALSPTHTTAVTSGAPCPVEVKEQITAWWGPVLHEYYGASEGYGHTYISAAESADHPGSVGRPLGDTRVHVTDDAGTPVPTGEIGKVWFEPPAATAYVNAGDTATSAGWKSMGDRGYLDEDGFLYLAGRESFMIISGGVNIYPEEIEAALVRHPDVVDAAVFGIPDPEFGEQVKAMVELREGVSGDATTAAGLIDYCRGCLATFKAPRSIDFVDRLPRLPTGKLNKKALRSHYFANS